MPLSCWCVWQSVFEELVAAAPRTARCESCITFLNVSQTQPASSLQGPHRSTATTSPPYHHPSPTTEPPSTITGQPVIPDTTHHLASGVTLHAKWHPRHTTCHAASQDVSTSFCTCSGLCTAEHVQRGGDRDGTAAGLSVKLVAAATWPESWCGAARRGAA